MVRSHKQFTAAEHGRLIYRRYRRQRRHRRHPYNHVCPVMQMVWSCLLYLL